jgi:hypothetical protein
MWYTVGLCDLQLQYSNDNSIYSQEFGCTLSKKQKEQSEAGTGTELILQSKPRQSVNRGGDMREAQVEVLLPVSHSCV